MRADRMKYRNTIEENIVEKREEENKEQLTNFSAPV